MSRIALPFPALPGKTAEDLKLISEEFKRRPYEYLESRRRQGTTLERAYLQTTPMGMFVVAYVENDRDPAELFGDFAQSDLPIDRFFREQVKELHGIDLTQPPAGPPPETVGEWVDPDVTGRRKGMAFTAPLVPDKVDEGREWARRTFSSPGMTESRRALGQNVEVVTLIQTPQGPVAAVYLEGTDPWEGNRRFAASTTAFDRQFKEELRKLFPPFIDFDQPVPGVEEIFDSETVKAGR
jgi:hypothetical protein